MAKVRYFRKDYFERENKSKNKTVRERYKWISIQTTGKMEDLQNVKGKRHYLVTIYNSIKFHLTGKFHYKKLKIIQLTD